MGANSKDTTTYEQSNVWRTPQYFMIDDHIEADSIEEFLLVEVAVQRYLDTNRWSIQKDQFKTKLGNLSVCRSVLMNGFDRSVRVEG
jgi:hypothetical protein